jgi:Dot/Icm secretion system protein IcmQ
MGKISDEEFIAKLIKIFDDLLEEDGWGSSFLLKVAQKRLLKARASLQEMKDFCVDESSKSVQALLTGDQMLVYVSLHQASGSNLVMWEQMLKVLSACSLGRPIYSCEEDAKKAVDSRPDVKKEAYVEVVVDKSAVLSISEDKVPRDHNGVKLLTLHQGAINTKGVRRFVYANKISYKFIDGKLIVE